MIEPKEFYKTYRADNNICELNINLVKEVLKYDPNHVLEFGCGTGKNLKLIQKMQGTIARSNIHVSGIDVSLLNLLDASIKNNLPHIALGDENYLRHYCNYDVVITVSVLDHIENIDGIMQELQRIANKAVVIAECIDHNPSKYYYAHDFKKYGFEKVEGSKFRSDADNHVYFIYKWEKAKAILSLNEFVNHAHDDLAH